MNQIKGKVINVTKRFLSWTAVILWMTLIFYLSHQPATESNKLSAGITEVIIQTIEKVAPNVEFDVRSLNHIIRKNVPQVINDGEDEIQVKKPTPQDIGISDEAGSVFAG